MENSETHKHEAKRQQLAATSLVEAMKLLRSVLERVQTLHGTHPDSSVRDDLQEAHYEIIDAMRLLESQTPATNYR